MTPFAVYERAPIMKTLISIAISAYSIAVAPVSARPNPLRTGLAASSTVLGTLASVCGAVQHAANVVEHRLQAVAGQLQRGDDNHGDQSGDQAVFDRGRTEIGLEEFANLRH